MELTEAEIKVIDLHNENERLKATLEAQASEIARLRAALRELESNVLPFGKNMDIIQNALVTQPEPTGDATDADGVEVDARTKAVNDYIMSTIDIEEDLVQPEPPVESLRVRILRVLEGSKGVLSRYFVADTLKMERNRVFDELLKLVAEELVFSDRYGAVKITAAGRQWLAENGG
jgi:hypothetical protein